MRVTGMLKKQDASELLSDLLQKIDRAPSTELSDTSEVV